MLEEETRLTAETGRAMRALARTVTDAPPLRLAPRPGTRAPRHSPQPRWTPWIVPLTAAAVVVALAISLVIIRDIPDGRAVVPAASASTTTPAGGVPAYYVALPGAGDLGLPPGSTEAVVADTFTGKQVAILRPKAGNKFFSVSAAADDRTFILGEGEHAQPATWYLARITTGSGVRVRMSRLPIPAQPPNSLVAADAVSPDGGELATLDVNSSTRMGEKLRLYSVASGALLRTWSSSSNLGDYGETLLSWTAGARQLAIGSLVRMWMLDVTRPGHNLIADSRLIWSVKGAGTFTVGKPSPFSCALDMTALPTADGKTVVCAGFGVFRATNPPGNPVCPDTPAWNTVGFLEYPTTASKPTRTLDKHNTSCDFTGFGGGAPLWTNASGSTVLGYFSFGVPYQATGLKPIIRFGVYSARSFTPLPVPMTTKTWGTPGIAW
jgi:hypothetical protein